MVAGSSLSPEIHRIVVRLSAILTWEQISTYTGISIAAVHNILNYFEKHQTVRAGEDGKEKERKKSQRQLRDVDVQVCYCNYHFHSMLTWMLVSLGSCQTLPWFIPRWAARAAGQRLWSCCFYSNSLEEAETGRTHEKEGMQPISVDPNLFF